MQIYISKTLSKEDMPYYEQLQQDGLAVNSLEGLALLCLNKWLEMGMVMSQNENGQNVLFVTMSDTRFGKKRDVDTAYVFIDEPEWKSWGKFEALNTSIHSYADKKGKIPDLEWFEARDKKLRVKVDPWEGVVVAPPASMLELIMSYLLAERGMVKISRNIVEIKAGCKDALVLDLCSAPRGVREMFNERIAIRLDKLADLCRKRMEKVSSKALTVNTSETLDS